MKSKIGIPNPCSEDWNQMTPTDRGAYCGKCQFDVIDFTQKSPEEIRTILKENVGKRTCGHIAPVQMDLVNTDYHVWSNQTPGVFMSKFLYACLLVFGMTLFTGCDFISEEHDVGEMEVGTVEDVGMIEDDTNASCVTGDTIVWDNDYDIVDGMIDMVEEQEPLDEE